MAEDKSATVVALQAPKQSELVAKWGAAVVKQGYCMVPSLLLRAQQRLGLNATQLAVLLQLCDYWWDQGRKPFPSKAAIGLRLGLKERQVQRHLAAMEKAGLLTRNERFYASGGQRTNEYDLSGLVGRLKALAPEFEEAKLQARDAKRRAAQRGGLRAVGVPKK